MPETADSPDWAARFSQSVAREVRRNREMRGMSAQQLSDECSKLGLPIHRSVISNFENGRRGNLTIPELLVIARALDVAPIFLLFPVGFVETVEALPGEDPRPIDALMWFAGDLERRVPRRERRVEDRIPFRLVLDEDQLVKQLGWEVELGLHLPGKAEFYLAEERAWGDKSLAARAEVRRLKKKLQALEEAVDVLDTEQIAEVRRDLEDAVRHDSEMDSRYANASDLARTTEMMASDGGVEARVAQISALRREMAKRGMLRQPLPDEIAEFFDEDVR